MQRILVVDDEPAVLSTLRVSLESHGFAIETAPDGTRGVMLALANRPDLIVLDLGLPDIDGIEVLRRIRATSRVPIVILSVRDADAQKIEALDVGADDYVTKPFSMGELVARIRAALRRLAPVAEEVTVETSAFVLDLAQRRALVNGVEVRLTPTEWSIVEHLVRHTGRLVTQKDLLEHVWGAVEAPDTSHLRVHLRHVRRKLEPTPSRPRFFRTEPGIGYRFDPSGGGSSS